MIVLLIKAHPTHQLILFISLKIALSTISTGFILTTQFIYVHIQILKILFLTRYQINQIIDLIRSTLNLLLRT